VTREKRFIRPTPDGVAEARVDADDVELEVCGLLLHDLDLQTRLEVVDNLLTSTANLKSSSSQLLCKFWGVKIVQ
jgi:hypothetical protein